MRPVQRNPYDKAHGTTARAANAARTIGAAFLVVLFAACSGATTSPETSVPGTDPVVRVEIGGDEVVSEPVATTSAPKPVSTVPAVTGDQGPNTAAAFIELREEEGGEIVRWWESRLTVAVVGEPTPTDLHTLARYIESVAEVDGAPRLELVTAAEADIVVHFLAKDRWREVIGEAIVGDDVDGQARYLQVDGDITEVTVVVNSASSQLQRNRTIVHEMLHAYGLGHHSCPGGLLYEGSEYEPEWRLSEYDRVLLSAWYAEHPGEPQVSLDLPCPALVWDTVVFEGTTLWCRMGTGECFEVDERTGVQTTSGPTAWYADGSITLYDPELYVAFASENGRVLCALADRTYRPCEKGAVREVTRPDRWFDGTSLYDYNPETHLVRIFEGRRLLCEKPGTNRAPCQFTEGQTLTGIDLYTDGEFVYETPAGG